MKKMDLKSNLLQKLSLMVLGFGCMHIAFAQTEGGEEPEYNEELVNESFTLVEEYRPELAEAIKWTFAPDLAPIPPKSSIPNYSFGSRQLDLPFVVAKVNPVALQPAQLGPTSSGFVQLGVGLRSLPELEFGLHASRKEQVLSDWGIGGYFRNTGAINIEEYRKFTEANIKTWLSSYSDNGIEVRPHLELNFSKHFLFANSNVPEEEYGELSDSITRNRTSFLTGVDITRFGEGKLLTVSLSPKVAFTSFLSANEILIDNPLTLAYQLTNQFSVGLDGFIQYQRISADSSSSRAALAAGPYIRFQKNNITLDGAFRVGYLDEFRIYPKANLVVALNSGKARLNAYLESKVDNLSLTSVSRYMPYLSEGANSIQSEVSIANVLSTGVGIALTPVSNVSIGGEVQYNQHDKLIQYIMNDKLPNQRVNFIAESLEDIGHTIVSVHSGFQFGKAFGLKGELQYHSYNTDGENLFHLPALVTKADVFINFSKQVGIETNAILNSGITGNESTVTTLPPNIQYEFSAVDLPAQFLLNTYFAYKIQDKFKMRIGADNILNTENPVFSNVPVFGIQPNISFRYNF